MAGPLRFLRAGRGRPGRAAPRLRRRPEQLAVRTPALAEEHTVYALDLPGHGGSAKDVGEGDGALADAVEQFLEAQSSSGRTSSGTRSAAWSPRRWRRAGARASLTLIAPAGFGQPVNRDYIDGFIAAESRRELKPVLQLLFADESLVTR